MSSFASPDIFSVAVPHMMPTSISVLALTGNGQLFNYPDIVASLCTAVEWGIIVVFIHENNCITKSMVTQLDMHTSLLC